MNSRAPAFAAVAVLILAAPAMADGDDAATLLRVFLTNGTSLVSYGEPARVGDRVVFSMPTAATANPPLHLVNLAADRVDWDRTNRYAASARATHYIKTQAETDYAALSNELIQTLNDVAQSTDSTRRLALVEEARKKLADWPVNHYNYRQAEVRQMLGLLDDAIADLRAATGAGRFALALSAFADPPTITEPLLPPPTPQEAIEQILSAARAVDSSVERTSLLGSALVAVERDKDALPSSFAASTRADVERAIDTELRIDRSYQALTAGVLRVADRRAQLGDVGALERLLQDIPQRDRALGGRRPESITALVATVEAKLDAARRLQLAREQWAYRAPLFAQYGTAIRTPIDMFAELKPSLEAIKSLSGSSPNALFTLQRVASRILKLMATIVPPAELSPSHALLVSAAQLAFNAADIRRQAALANDMNRAWNASSAAAGALMLGARAQTDIQVLLRPPNLR